MTIDHRAEAETLLGSMRRLERGSPADTSALLEALVHATLAGPPDLVTDEPPGPPPAAPGTMLAIPLSNLAAQIASILHTWRYEHHDSEDALTCEKRNIPDLAEQIVEGLLSAYGNGPAR